MFQFLKGFKSIILMVLLGVNGALTQTGFWTPELGADITGDVRAAIDQMELMVGLVQQAVAALGVGVRAVTDSPIFNRQ